MADLLLDVTTVTTASTKSINIATDAVPEITATTAIRVEVEPNNYILTSEGVYSGNVPNGVPAWLHSAITDVLIVGDSTLEQVLADIRGTFDTLEQGVNSSISGVRTDLETSYALDTTVVSRIDDSQATILEVVATKATLTEASAVAVNVLEATFGYDAKAYIESVALAYTDDQLAISTFKSSTVASLDNITPRLDTAEYAVAFAQTTADESKTWYQATAPILSNEHIGNTWVDTSNDNLAQMWAGTTLGWKDITSSQGNELTLWAVGASKLITAPDGAVTGWEFSDSNIGDNNTRSVFKIKAQNFSISDGVAGGHTPFEIIGTDIYLNGDVYIGTKKGSTIPIHLGSFSSLDIPTANNAGDTYYSVTDLTTYYWTGEVWNTTAGVDGIADTVHSVINYYQISTSATTEPTSWLAANTIAVPTSSNPYLWNYEVVSYTISEDSSTPAAVIGTYSIDGTSVTGIAEFYMTTSTTTAPSLTSTSWSSTIPILTVSNKYLWNKEVITLTAGDGLSTNLPATGPAMIGAYGDQGDQGDQGDSITGPRGSAILSYGISTTAAPSGVSSASLATYWNAASTVYDIEVLGDQLILTNSNTSVGWTHIYEYNGYSWVSSTALTINGSMVVEGTITGNMITIGQLTSPNNGFVLDLDSSYGAVYNGTVADENGIRIFNQGVCRVKLGKLD